MGLSSQSTARIPWRQREHYGLLPSTSYLILLWTFHLSPPPSFLLFLPSVLCVRIISRFKPGELPLTRGPAAVAQLNRLWVNRKLSKSTLKNHAFLSLQRHTTVKIGKTVMSTCRGSPRAQNQLICFAVLW